jgi:DNA polymerase-1
MSRQEAKTVNFGILYGIGPTGLELRTRFDRQAGERFINLWFEEYPDVYEARRRIHYLALKRGYVDTSYGRRRHFPLGLDSRSQDGGRAERQAFNFIIQATANDLNVLFLVEWCKRGLHELGFPIFAIHDAVLFSTADPGEMLFELDKGYRTWYADAVEEFIGEDLCVILRADAKLGPNWGEMVGEDDEGERYWWFSTHEDEAGNQNYEAIPGGYTGTPQLELF